MERVLELLPLVGLGCMMAALLGAAVYIRQGPESREEEEEYPALVLIFRDYPEGVEGLVRWLMWQRGWRDGTGSLLVGWGSQDEAAMAEMQAILRRLQRQFPSLHLLPASGVDEGLYRSSRVLVIARSSGVPWETLRAVW